MLPISIISILFLSVIVPVGIATAQTNYTNTLVPSPNIIYPQQPAVVNQSTSPYDMTGILALTGTALTFLIGRMNEKKASGERNNLLDGGLTIANIVNKAVNSLKETDYGDQDQARLFNNLVQQLNKVPEFQKVLNEKIETNDTDLLLNNKSIIEAAQDNLNQIIRDNKQYYENLVPTAYDTCDNRLIRAVSRADKMTSKNG